jgi:hypothetical protein
VCKQSSVVRHYDIGNKKTSRNYPIHSYKAWFSVTVTMRDEASKTERHDYKNSSSVRNRTGCLPNTRQQYDSYCILFVPLKPFVNVGRNLLTCAYRTSTGCPL